MSSGWSRVAQPQFVPRGMRLARLFNLRGASDWVLFYGHKNKAASKRAKTKLA